MRRLMYLAFAAISLSSISGLVFAQAGLTGITQNVRQLDKNFDIADKNHDGKLSREEAKAGPVPFIAKHFDAIDASRSGFVTKADVHAYIGKALTRSQASPPVSSSSAH